MSEKRPPGLMLYKEARTILAHLTPEQLYSVFHAMNNYFERGEIPHFGDGSNETLAWAVISQQIDEHVQHYKEISNKRSDAARGKKQA